MRDRTLARRRALGLGCVLMMAAAVLVGCLSRDVVEQEPGWTNVFIKPNTQGSINEIDLLFVIDNSGSMGDKQEILRKAVPQMVERLVNPLCENGEGDTLVNSTGTCPEGYRQEFLPVNDIHIGVISSSLGGHGSAHCPRDDARYNNDDRAYLIPHVRPNAPNPSGQGFLTWTGGDETVREQLVQDFEAQVSEVGEIGCGFEAPLEAWYRFLIDPEPPVDIAITNGRAGPTTDAEGKALVDGAVLDQREAFLRPEGLVAIVVLTDENDCSIMDGGSHYDFAGYGHLVAERPDMEPGPGVTRGMPVASSVCETNPNDRCCFSCLTEPPEGCDASACEGDELIAPELDNANVRCFDNKRRFGIDLLYPTSRYVSALRDMEIVNARNGEMMDNPLLRGAGPSNEGVTRPAGRVFFAGIVGVPWQDVATEHSLTDAGTMRLLTAEELNAPTVELAEDRWVSRWEVILGNPGTPMSSKDCEEGSRTCGQAPVAPHDPFMIESVDPRPTGAANPISGDLIVEFTSTDPLANDINGHEVDNNFLDDRGLPMRDDLQYACIFPLEREACAPGDPTCDCGEEPNKNRPLCQPPTGGPAGTDQYFGKAYPGTRILQVLRDFGENSIVGSICPKVLTGVDPSDANYGYNPAVQSIIDRLKDKLNGTCLPRELTLSDTGEVPCAVVETRQRSEDGPLNCDAPGRRPLNPGRKNAMLDQLEELNLCGEGTDVDCGDFDMCEVEELTGQAQQQCYFDDRDPATFAEPGFCYIDPSKTNEAGEYIAGGDENGENPLVAGCKASERRMLRFVGVETPAKDSTTFVACTADTASVKDSIPEPPSGEAVSE